VKHTRIIVTYYGGPDALQVLEEECPEQEKGTGYFSTSFLDLSSSPQHGRETVREVCEKSSLSHYLVLARGHAPPQRRV